MEKRYKVVDVPEKGTRHHLGNFGLVEITKDLPSEICEEGFKLKLPYFAEDTDTVEAPKVTPTEVAVSVNEPISEPSKGTKK